MTPTLGLLHRTIRELPPGRVLHRIARPTRGLSRRLLFAAGGRPGAVAPAELDPIVVPSLPARIWTPPSTFDLLNLSRELGPGLGPPEAPRLWAYQFHALDALREAHPLTLRLGLLDRWSGAHAFASTPGWEPYPTSLRIVNGLELLAAAGADQLAPRAEPLALQAWWLEANLERDVGANHLLKNGFALAWAGRVLRGRAPARWRASGDAILQRELASQLLDDGFSVERSPAYHAVLVDDLVRFERLLRTTGESREELGDRVTDARRRAAAVLASVLHPDGEIPLFNDAALGQAPDASWILDCAASLDEGRRAAPNPIGAPAAGFYRLAGVRSVVLFDAGEIGFAEQPAHAHADTLSFELSYGATRVIVDAGVFDYAPTKERAYARGTRSHNTVELDGLDQSELWGTFRVGRKARPMNVRRQDTDGKSLMEASHDGYRHLHGRPVHRRRMEHLGGDVWLVDDLVSGGGAHHAVSRLRLHPSFRIVRESPDAIEASDGSIVARVIACQPARVAVERGAYFPRFGVAEECSVVRFDASGPLPLTIRYRLELTTTESPSA